MHYAVPRILHEAGMLYRLYTDICAVKGWPKLLRWVPNRLLAGGIKRLADRDPSGVPTSKITTYNAFGLHYAIRRMRGQTRSEAMRTKAWAAKELAKRIPLNGVGESSGIYAFNIQALEVFQKASHQTLKILEQCSAPREKERDIMEEEFDRFPNWEDQPHTNPMDQVFIEREKKEWDAADIILCPSEFVRQSVVACGGSDEKCAVVPYGVDADNQAATEGPKPPSDPIRVLTVGNVRLQKGGQYVYRAAELLGDRADFRMVGSIAVSEHASGLLDRFAELTGRVPRSEVSRHYDWADIFLLPSLCEGSATVTYEAMAHGLPVICTPNTGSVVRNGQDGFIVPIRDAEAIAERIMQLAGDETLYQDMSMSAKERAVTVGSVEAYGKRLLKTITERVSSHA